MTINERLQKEFSISSAQVENTVALLDDGATVPFIARYRKDETGNLDDQTLRALADSLEALRKLEARREDVARLIDEQGKLDSALSARIQAAQSLTGLDDLYRPYRPKRKTRASQAIARGLEPLADAWLAGKREDALLVMAEKLAAASEEVADAKAALDGACDILAERLADDADVRTQLRARTASRGVIVTKAGKKPDPVYDNYLDYSEALSKMAPHRILAVERAEKAEALVVHLEGDEEWCVRALFKHIFKRGMVWQDRLNEMCQDSYKRLLAPSIEKEVRKERREWAEKESTVLFQKNLHDLLMQPPVRGHVVLGFDPGFTNGCKLAVIDPTGNVLETVVVYPFKGKGGEASAKKTIMRLINTHRVTLVAIGNGIARRVQDPLAELVKIDPKSIGVGQYQHDIDQKLLTHALDGVVEECVNHVGVDLNTASVSLLSHVAGVSNTVAKNIVSYRDQNGNFCSRKGLLKVPKLGPKAFEQCAGFLRIAEGDEPLDNTQVHPESYDKVRALAKLFDCAPSPELAKKAKEENIVTLAEKLTIGPMALHDILDALEKPGRDPRADLPQPALRHDLLELEDLEEGMELDGTVTNIAAFGAFVDIGLHENGLVHISELSDQFVRDPLTVVHVSQVVRVRVLSVDKKRRRIALSMKGVSQP